MERGCIHVCDGEREGERRGRREIGLGRVGGIEGRRDRGREGRRDIESGRLGEICIEIVREGGVGGDRLCVCVCGREGWR